MTLSELLKVHLRDPHTQKSVAMSWLSRAGERWKPPTVESHISRCLRGQRQGVRFFFGELEHARMLLDVLDVPERDRAPIYAAAEELLKMDKDRPPRLIVDVTARSGRLETRRLFEELRAAIIDTRPLEPVLLLLTESQYDDLPRSFDQHEEWFRVEMIGEAEAPARLADPSCSGALVASFRRHAPPDRWIAMDFDPKLGKLRFAPPDGFERFARDGALALPEVVHDLAAFVDDVPLPSFDADKLGPLEQRMAMEALRGEGQAERVSKDPAMRLAMARALGVVATATPRDRIEAALRAAASGLGAANLDSMAAEAFQKLLTRAGMRRQPPTMVRVGDQIEVVNPVEGQPGLAHPRVRVHRIEAADPAFTRLRAAVSRWTVGDFEADPFLDRLLLRLDPDGHERLAFLHARAALLIEQQFRPQRGRPIEDWRPRLARLLAHDVPAATLRLVVDQERSGSYLTVAGPSWVDVALRGAPSDANSLKYPRPAAVEAVPISRDETVLVATPNEGRHSRDRRKPQIVALDLETTPPDVGSAAERWLDSFEEWRSHSGYELRSDDREQIGSLPWKEADRQLGLTWLALQMAARAAPAVRLHDGRVLLQVGDGIVARVDLRETAESVEPRAMLDAFSRFHDLKHWELSVGVASGVSSIELAIPQRVVLLGEQARVEVELLGSALFLGASGRKAIAVAELARRADDRAQIDDDDDD